MSAIPDGGVGGGAELAGHGVEWTPGRHGRHRRDRKRLPRVCELARVASESSTDTMTDGAGADLDCHRHHHGDGSERYPDSGANKHRHRERRTHGRLPCGQRYRTSMREIPSEWCRRHYGAAGYGDGGTQRLGCD